MLDSTTINIKRLELRAAHAKRVQNLIADLDEALDKEEAMLQAQLARVNDHRNADTA